MHHGGMYLYQDWSMIISGGGDITDGQGTGMLLNLNKLIYHIWFAQTKNRTLDPVDLMRLSGVTRNRIHFTLAADNACDRY